MSTFRLPQTILIEFGEGIYAGAEVRCRANLSIRETLELTAAQPDDMENATADETVALIDVFARLVVVSWNLVDENDEAIEVTPENVANQPAGFVLQLFSSWAEATTGTPKASEARSPNGSMSKAESEAMAAG